MIDAHIHFSSDIGAEDLKRFLEENGMTGIALQCIPKGGVRAVEEDAFSYAERSGIPVYIFGGLSRNIWSEGDRASQQKMSRDQVGQISQQQTSEEQVSQQQLSDRLLAEARRLMACGCTGIKMLEGKPDVRKNFHIPDFDTEVWDSYWSYLEENEIPVYFHVNDPEEFWNPNLVADYVKAAGWFYGDGYIGNEEQYRQVLQVLSNHPNLKILFPHFFFLSADLPRLSGILDSFKNVRIDVTPGVELYYNLSENVKEAKAFFEKYQDRILYGTDIGARNVIAKEDKPFNLEESKARVRLIRDFLEKKCDYLLIADGAYVKEREPTVMHGLGLDENVLAKIYVENFLEFIKR
ncbi:MAG: amidohydrolase family protein [Hespellia sp.]|nr:amidohydrolase family protein [Hespellia sp.]